jgi:hypothetical protein
VTIQAAVYRVPARDRNSDPVDDDGNPISLYAGASCLGTLDVTFANTQATSVEPRLTGTGGGNVDRSETADVKSLVGAPRRAEILLRHGDRLLIADSEGYSLRYRVVGPRLFDYPNSLSGWEHQLYWVRVEATDG